MTTTRSTEELWVEATNLAGLAASETAKPARSCRSPSGLGPASLASTDTFLRPVVRPVPLPPSVEVRTIWPYVWSGLALALVAIVAFAALSGGGAKGGLVSHPPTTAAGSAVDFAGAGAGSTPSFTPPKAFALEYSVSCTSAVTTGVDFLLRNADGASLPLTEKVTNGIGGQGVSKGLAAGAYTVQVTAPPSCSWTVQTTTS